MFLYGKNSVFERLKYNPKSIRKVFLEEGFNSPHIEKLIKNKNVSLKRVSVKELKRIKEVRLSQGIIAEVDEFEYAHLEDLISRPKPEKFSLIFLDRIFDPQNLGAIIRTTACFGAFAIIIPKHKACAITETVLHVACGGENFTPVVMVSNLSNALLKAKDSGYWAAGALVSGGQDIAKTELPFPLCFILGSEGEGLRYGVEKHLDIKVHIPMRGTPLSFNVTAAAAVFCYEVTKQFSLEK
ncbi:MAG: 23S rRNA (guanosine(2251)-2'-O)-methyltransferase RlmB [Candidatus Omnitrophota bacterium]